jgi:hypothetical protein
MLGGAGSMRRILRLLVRAIPGVRAFTAVDVATTPYFSAARRGAMRSRQSYLSYGLLFR